MSIDIEPHPSNLLDLVQKLRDALTALDDRGYAGRCGEAFAVVDQIENATRALVPQPDDLSAYVPDLTEAEQRVAAYLPSRMTMGEIGRHLYLSPNTVKTHIKRIYAKLGADGRAHAVAILAARKREQAAGGAR